MAATVLSLSPAFQKGEHFGLGNNGAKTTLFSLLLDLIQASPESDHWY